MDGTAASLQRRRSRKPPIWREGESTTTKRMEGIAASKEEGKEQCQPKKRKEWKVAPSQKKGDKLSHPKEEEESSTTVQEDGERGNTQQEQGRPPILLQIDASYISTVTKISCAENFVFFLLSSDHVASAASAIPLTDSCASWRQCRSPHNS